MLTIEGAFDLASSGMAYLQPRNTPSAFTAITRRHSENGVCSTSPGVPMPALLTRPSSRPCVRPISAIAAFQSSSLVTSSAMSTLPREARSLRIGLAARRLDRRAHGGAQRAERTRHEHDVILRVASAHRAPLLQRSFKPAGRAADAERGIEHDEIHEAVPEQLGARSPAASRHLEQGELTRQHRRRRRPPASTSRAACSRGRRSARHRPRTATACAAPS